MEHKSMEQHGMERKGLEYTNRGASQSLQGKVKAYLDIAFRRKWLIVSFVIISLAASGGFAWFKKDLYRSSTVILVEQQTIPEKYVASVVNDVASRVSTITQQVLSRTSLLKVIEDFGLFQNTIKTQGYEPAIVSLRKNIRVETKGTRGTVEACTISFSHEDPTMAMKVTARIASQYIEQNLRLREQFVEGASDFLESELKMAQKELEAKEQVLSKFKQRYMGELPVQLDGNLRSLDRLQAERTSNQEALNTLNTRLGLVQTAIHEYQTSGAMNAPEAPKGSGNPKAIDPQVSLLKKLEHDLINLSAEYTDAYPDVIVLTQQVKMLKTELAEKYSVTEEEVMNPEIIRAFDPYLNGLIKDQNEIKVQMQALTQRQKSVSALMEKLQQSVDRTATREQELLTLERNYANLQANYQDLLSKRTNARISENLEKRQKAERFRILDPANLPTKPEGPNRWVILAAGFFVGCGLGYAVAFAMEQWNPTFRRSEEAEVSLGFPILASIPSFQLAFGKSLDSLPSAQSMMGGEDSEAPLSSSRALSRVQSGGGHWWSGGAGSGSDLSLVTRWRPSSTVAEQYRVAATRLAMMNDEQANTVVLATSAMKGEGKTSSVANLGYTLARDLDKQTLIIGCDFKSPRLHEPMGMPSSPGLADFLAGDVPLDSCIYRMDEVPLWVLPAGDTEEHVVSLSRFPQLSSLLETLRPRFDFILLDAPPILPLADMNVLSNLADILVLVVRAGVTPQEIVVKAMDMLRPSVPARILLTDSSSQGMPYFAREVYGAPYAAGERV
jgi:polysaccharide chain length determinant protein (PEP-CTERM system associated)